MKSVSRDFVTEFYKEVGAHPVVRPKLYAKYPGMVRYIAGGTYILGGLVTQTISVYGNATRFFANGDYILIKSLPLTDIGTIASQPAFDGTDTSFGITGITLTQENLSGFVLRDLDFKFIVGSS